MTEAARAFWLETLSATSMLRRELARPCGSFRKRVAADCAMTLCGTAHWILREGLLPRHPPAPALRRDAVEALARRLVHAYVILDQDLPWHEIRWTPDEIGPDVALLSWILRTLEGPIEARLA